MLTKMCFLSFQLVQLTLKKVLILAYTKRCLFLLIQIGNLAGVCLLQ